MNILVSINRPYIKYFLTMINSLSKSNEEETFDIYIMHSNLDDKDKELIKKYQLIQMKRDKILEEMAEYKIQNEKNNSK